MIETSTTEQDRSFCEMVAEWANLNGTIETGDNPRVSVELDDEDINDLGLELSCDATQVFEWIRENFAPDDIFPEEELQTWAESKGLVDPDR